MVKEKYKIDDLVISAYKSEDEQERYRAVSESISALSEWLSIFNNENLREANKNWLKNNEQNWDNGIEYCFKISKTDSPKQIGEIRINHINYSHKLANVTYWTRSGEEGKGIITKALKKVIEICFDDLQLNRIEMYMSVNNFASKAIAEKACAKLEGVMRKRIVRKNKIEDAYLYSVIKEDIKND